jgi:hypothetical protein
MGKLQGEIDNCSDRVNKSKVYGSDYQKAVKSQQILTNLPFNTVDLTTKAIVHAMTSSSPQSRYAVGLDAKAIRLMQNVLPDSVMDIGMKIFV